MILHFYLPWCSLFHCVIFSRFREVALQRGWKQPEAKQRNPFIVFRGSHGAVHWYLGGLVILYLRGSVMLAKVKELFCKAFSFLPDEMLLRYLDAPLGEEARHWVFDLGAPVPRGVDNRNFERSHGIRIRTDGSHPQALEVDETRPFWLDPLEKVTEKLSFEIDEHLKLIRTWTKEAETERMKRKKESRQYIDVTVDGKRGSFDPSEGRPVIHEAG